MTYNIIDKKENHYCLAKFLCLRANLRIIYLKYLLLCENDTR